jgi:RNA polymerase sigma-70 factor (ECF subfamily)
VVRCVTEVDDVASVIDRCGDRLYALALRITGAQDDAAAAIEEALGIVALRSATDTGVSLEACLYRSVARAAHQRLRQRRRDVPPIIVDDVVPALDADGQHFEPMDDWSARIDDHMRHSAKQAALSAAIDALPPDVRTALILHDVEGASSGDIAQIMGVDVPAVKLHVHRGRLFVRKRLATHFAVDHAA